MTDLENFILLIVASAGGVLLLRLQRRRHAKIEAERQRERAENMARWQAHVARYTKLFAERSKRGRYENLADDDFEIHDLSDFH